MLFCYSIPKTSGSEPNGLRVRSHGDVIARILNKYSTGISVQSKVCWNQCEQGSGPWNHPEHGSSGTNVNTGLPGEM